MASKKSKAKEAQKETPEETREESTEEQKPESPEQVFEAYDVPYGYESKDRPRNKDTGKLGEIRHPGKPRWFKTEEGNELVFIPTGMKMDNNSANTELGYLCFDISGMSPEERAFTIGNKLAVTVASLCRPSTKEGRIYTDQLELAFKQIIPAHALHEHFGSYRGRVGGKDPVNEAAGAYEKLQTKAEKDKALRIVLSKRGFSEAEIDNILNKE